MKITIFIPTASVEGDKPTPWLKQLLDAGIEYARARSDDECAFLISGRWNKAEAEFMIPEAEVAKRYILTQIPSARVFKEDLALETGGNFAFSKPFLNFLKPDLVIVINSRVKEERSKYFAKKIFGPDFKYDFLMVSDIFSENPRAKAKEPKAMGMFKALFDHLKDGDDVRAREILLYSTPFYYRGMIDDKEFFDKYWDGALKILKRKG